jgi:hypothetical protein
MYTRDMNTATSTYGNVHEVTISAKGIVRTASGVLLGDVDGMELLGWEFAEVVA